MNKELKLGIIGTGWPGQMHAEALRAIEEVSLYACADLDDTRRSAFKENYASEKSYGDYHELLQDRDVDAAVICLPNYLHFPAALAASRPGNTSYVKNRRH